jgi:hypothetical protein
MRIVGQQAGAAGEHVVGQHLRRDHARLAVRQAELEGAREQPVGGDPQDADRAYRAGVLDHIVRQEHGGSLMSSGT